MLRSILLLHVIAFVDLLAIGFIVPLISSHVRKLGGSHIQVGLLGSLYAGAQLGSGPFIGSLSDLKGSRKILLVTLILCGITYTISGLTRSVTVILLTRAIVGLFKQTQMLTKALVPEYEKCETMQGEIYGHMAAISGAGITLGPIIGGHIAEAYPNHGFTVVAITVGLCFVANAGLVSFLPKQAKPKQKKCKKKSLSTNIIDSMTNSINQSLTQLCKIQWHKYWDIFILKVLVSFAMGVYYSNYPLYLKSVYNLSPKYIGYVISFQGIIGSISSYKIGFINSFYVYDKDYSVRIYHVFLLTTLSVFGLILSLNVYMYLFWLVPLAVGNAVGRLTSLEMILKRSRGEHRAALIGASNSARSLTGVVSPMVAGLINEYYGVSYVIYASFLSLLVGLVLSYHKFKKVKLE